MVHLRRFRHMSEFVTNTSEFLKKSLSRLTGVGVAAPPPSLSTGCRTPRASDPVVPDTGAGLRTAGFGRVAAVGVTESKSTQGTVTQTG